MRSLRLIERAVRGEGMIGDWGYDKDWKTDSSSHIGLQKRHFGRCRWMYSSLLRHKVLFNLMHFEQNGNVASQNKLYPLDIR